VFLALTEDWVMNQYFGGNCRFHLSRCG